MYIDRIFSQPGFGTIVNGSVLSGKLDKNDPLYLLPGGRELRIRKLQRHGKDVNELKAGDRGSLNLVNLKIKDFQKGALLASQTLKETKLCDAKLTLFDDDVNLGLWNQVIFLLGTIRMMVRVHLLNRNELEKGEAALVQIYLPKPVIIQFNDPFIIRNSSGDRTLGGGVIVDPYPLHHRRRRKPQIDIVQKMASGDPLELLSAEVRKSILPVSYKEIAEQINTPKDELEEIIFSDLPGDLFLFQIRDDVLLFQKKRLTALQNKILANLQNYHAKNPLLKTGRNFKELMGVFGIEQNDKTKQTLELILKDLEDNGKIRKLDNTYILPEHQVEFDAETEILIEDLMKYFNKQGSDLIDLKEITEYFSQPEKKIRQVMEHLKSEGRLVYLQKKIISGELFNKFKDLVVEYLLKNEEGITVAVFRDMISGNRNNAMVLLEYLDSEGITLRKGNIRVLKKSFLSNMKREEGRVKSEE